MCAITGMISTLPISKELFEKMNNAATHRGPDGHGLYFDGNIALGHRRLAIIDLTPMGHQPMEKQGLCITYNGEIYNYRELRQELEKLGHTFRSESDTEVILSAYLQWGPACVQKFNGMWAFAIYNSKDHTLFCSRDRFGVKPFYYWRNSQKLIFSSEIRQILTDPSVPREMNTSIVSAYLVSSIVDHTDETFFKGIHKLPAGHQLFVNTKTLQFKIEKYFDISQKNTSYEPKDFPELMTDAVRLRLRSDTPVGSSLSGGVDSSLIVSLACRMTPNYRFQTFTAVPYDGHYDESEYVRKLANDLPIDAHYTKPQPEEFATELKTVIETQEEPFLSPSIFMQYFVMKKAHEKGLKVLLDGQGADEIFLGYEKYFPTMLKYVAGKNPVGATRMLADLLKNNKNVSLGFLARVYLKSQWVHQLSPQAKAFRQLLQPEFANDSTFIEINRSS
ncbi:asparagine synthase (glutamine-hydrolyzing), partial [bacterium]|nr:asparagine synthase (glutamine-hydrolyzing) [bacterium]